MVKLSGPIASFLVVAAFSLPLNRCTPAFANGKTGPAELAKYLNPMQKNGYLNQSQDRVIKKKAFKAQSIAVEQPAANHELGFFAMIAPEKISDLSYVEDILSHDNVSGISVQLPWGMLEPTEDNFNWQPLDQLLSACEQHHKTAILRVITCGNEAKFAAGQQTSEDTPNWVFDGGAKFLSYKAADGTTHKMPIFWDKNYLAKWSNFVGEFADRYDKNPNIHSIGITGGGYAGGTCLIPEGGSSTEAAAGGKAADLTSSLKKDYGLTQRQMVEHWKYVADLFPKKFQTAHLNFNVNAPAHGRWGEDALDEIGDYLVYRYGERIYLTRSIKDGKHRFDDYRLLLKFHNDTLTGMQLPPTLSASDMPNVAKHALEDGISFAEMPPSLLASTDQTVQTALNQLRSHMGYEIISQQTVIPEKVTIGQPMKASFTFLNAGAAGALRPERNFDKDSAMSYRVEIELRDADGKPVLANVHTPPTSTAHWEPGKPITWDTELKMVDSEKHQLPPGDYTVWMSLVDANAKHKIQFLHATSDGKFTSGDTVQVGKLTVTNAVADTKLEPTATGVQDRHE